MCNAGALLPTDPRPVKKPNLSYPRLRHACHHQPTLPPLRTPRFLASSATADPRKRSSVIWRRFSLKSGCVRCSPSPAKVWGASTMPSPTRRCSRSTRSFPPPQKKAKRSSSKAGTRSPCSPAFRSGSCASGIASSGSTTRRCRSSRALGTSSSRVHAGRGPRPKEPFFDYTDAPAAAPAGWPAFKPNDSGISRLVYSNMHDYMRRVCTGVMVGKAYKLDVDQGAYFSLSRA